MAGFPFKGGGPAKKGMAPESATFPPSQKVKAQDKKNKKKKKVKGNPFGGGKF